MAAPEFALVLADSTAYGWLENSALGGTELVHRNVATSAEQRSALVAAVVCGGSLIKKGSAGPCAVDVLTTEWLLKGGAAAFAAEHEVEVGVVPMSSRQHSQCQGGTTTACSEHEQTLGCRKQVAPFWRLSAVRMERRRSHCTSSGQKPRKPWTRLRGPLCRI